MAARLLESLFVTGYGTTAASGYVYFYQPGTLTPVSVYSNDAATSVVTQPVRLDANGRTSSPLYLKAPARCIIQNSGGATLADIERIDGDRAELVALANASWPGSTSDNAAWTALATSLGGTDGKFKSSGTGSTARSVQAKLSEQLSVKDFGATGDGVTDDTASLISTIAAAASLGGAIVFFPPGTYLVAQAISVTSSNITFLGAGPTASVIKNTSASGNAFSLTGTTNSITFDNLGISNSGTSTGAAISAVSTSDGIIFSRLTITGHRTGVLSTIASGTSAGTGVTIIECFIYCNANNAANVCANVTNNASSFFQIIGGSMKASVGGSQGTCVTFVGADGFGTMSAIGGSYINGNVAFAISGGVSDVVNLIAANCTTTTTPFTVSGGVRVNAIGGAGLNPPAGAPSVAYYDPRVGSWGDTSGLTQSSIAITSAYTPVVSSYGCFRINGTAAAITITINNPTNVGGGAIPYPGSRFTIIFTNTSGGAVTWAFGTAYKVAAVAPATGTAIGVTFLFDDVALVWREISRGSAAAS